MTRVGIIGGGPAGLMCAVCAKRENPDIDVTIFESKDIGHTLLPTGGGRCNISHFGNDIKSFVQNYPRGEKFLYSIFNQFFIADTIEFFKSIGIETYIQEDERIFPKTNKSLDVIFALKNEIKRLNIQVINKKAEDIIIKNNGFIIDNRFFDKIVISTGGKDDNILQKFGHNIIPQKPALSSLETEEKYFSQISGVSIKNVQATVVFKKHSEELSGDLLFTHKGVSGPLIYKISSLFAKDDYNKTSPLSVSLNFTGYDINLQNIFDKNPQKSILNTVTDFIPKSLAKILLSQNEITENKKCSQINKREREKIMVFLTALKLHGTAPVKGGEIVSAGGIDLKEINPKTMESKIVKNLYFCGEVIDVDGFCGGYNLQNCWSTGYVAGINTAN